MRPRKGREMLHARPAEAPKRSRGLPTFDSPCNRTYVPPAGKQGWGQPAASPGRVVLLGDGVFLALRPIAAGGSRSRGRASM